MIQNEWMMKLRFEGKGMMCMHIFDENESCKVSLLMCGSVVRVWERLGKSGERTNVGMRLFSKVILLETPKFWGCHMLRSCLTNSYLF